LPVSAAYAGRRGARLEDRPRQQAVGGGWVFYSVIGAAGSRSGLTIDYSGLDPIKALYWSAVGKRP